MEKNNSNMNVPNKKEWASTQSQSSASSNREEDEEFVTARQRHSAQYGMNVAAMPNYDIFPRYANHTYHNYATFLEDGGKIEKHKKCERNFPALLHAMLSDEKYSHIISWMPHGRAWKVLNKKLLVEQAIPKFFGQSMYASFTRQLSGWGFKRLHQTGPDFGCYYHECFLRGHPRLTALMRRVTSGQGKATINIDEEPDFYLIAQQFPLGKSDKVPEKDNKRVKAEALFSESQKTEYLGDFDLEGETSWYQREDVPPVARTVTAPEMETMTHHQWDPFVQSDFVNPPQRAAAHKAAEINTTNQSTKSFGRFHSFASTDANGGEQGSKEGQDQAESSDLEAINCDPIPLSNYQLDPHRDRGYSDPFPVSNHQLGLHSGYSMYPAHQEVHTNQYYGSNVNQYAAGKSHPAGAAAAAGGYYYSQPHHYQQYDPRSYNMFGHDYWYRNRYNNNYYRTQGLVQCSAQPQGANMAQINYPAQGVRSHNLSRPDFSPVKLTSKEDKEASDSKPRT